MVAAPDNAEENLMNIPVADVTVHLDQSLAPEQRLQMEDRLRAVEGVISVHNPDSRPHLAIVGYNPERTSSAAILHVIAGQGVHAELIGL